MLIQTRKAAEKTIMEEAVKLGGTIGLTNPKQAYQTLLHQARRTQKKRRAQMWNAYLRQEVRRRNDGEFNLFSIDSCLFTRRISELPEGVPRRKASAYAGEISAVWQEMTKEEQENATADALEELKEHRENKAVAHHNNARSAFQDTRATLNTIECEVSQSIHECSPC
jgi:hypothetical protein